MAPLGLLGRCVRSAALLSIMFGTGLPVHAIDSSDAASASKQAIEAFRAGRYDIALIQFTAAYDAGRRDPRLFYNLGAVQFKLGNFAAAYDWFDRIGADSRWGPLAQYNLGLIQERRGDADAAQQHFRRAYGTADSTKLRRLAALKLGQAGSSSTDEQAWFGFASMAGGYDDNVVLLDDQSLASVSDQDDFFVEALASASGFVQGGIGAGWRADVSGYYRAYRDQTDYDYGALVSGLTYNRMTGAMQWQAGGRADVQFVGGNTYTVAGTARTQWLRPIAGFMWRVRNDASYIDGADDFGYLTGWRDRLSVQVSRRIGASRLRLGYELELNNREDSTSDLEFFSYSPTLSRFYGSLSRTLSDRFEIQVDGEYQISRYPDKNIEVDPNGSLTIASRDGDRVIATLRTTYRPLPAWGVFGEYSYTNNSSNISQYQYSDNQIMIGIEREF